VIFIHKLVSASCWSSKFIWLKWQQYCPPIMKMCKVNIKDQNSTQKTHSMFIKKNVMELNFEHFHWTLKQKFLNFPWITVKIGIKLIIQINLYMHFVTLEEEQHTIKRNVPRILFVYMSSVYFSTFIYCVKNVRNFCQLCFIYYYGYNRIYYSGTKKY